jgi:hypothetical protein
MWIYGSRAAGTQRPDDDPNPSDLDIAVDIDDMQESDSDTFQRGQFAEWRTEVQAIVAPYHLHLGPQVARKSFASDGHFRSPKPRKPHPA